MQYLGGKSRIANKLAAFIKERHPNSDTIVEPFMGGGAMTTALAPLFKKVLAYDINQDLILMWQALKDGWVPPTDLSELDYKKLKDAPPISIACVCWFWCVLRWQMV
jgi:hypothetical protein